MLIKTIFITLSILFLSGNILLPCSAQTLPEKLIEIKISHFAPSTWSQQTHVLEPWAKKIETLTNGRLRFSFFLNESLGKANEQYDLVLKGIADIGCSITEYTPERFPLTSSMKLPFLGVQSGEQASLVLWRIYRDHLKKEFQDTKVLWLWCHSPGQIHTVNKPIRTLEDLKGLRIKITDPGMARVLEELGAVPVICTAPDTYLLLKKGELDGVIIPWEGAYAFDLLQFCKYHTLVNFYTMPFFAVMNKDKYHSLPEDIKKIIDDNSGEEMAVTAGQVSDHEDLKGIALAEKRGDFIYTMPASELNRWKTITMPLGDEWIEKMKTAGLPGDKVLTAIVDLFLQLQK